MNHIIMIGFMGSGKSTVGRRLAKHLEIPFIDSDDMIEEKCQMKISTLFAEKGEPYFRELETQCLKELKEKDQQMVIAVGGGLPMKPENQILMHELGTVIFLDASVDTLAGRLKNDNTRPKLAGSGDLKEKILNLMNLRMETYRGCSDLIISTDDKDHAEIVHEISEILEKTVEKNM